MNMLPESCIRTISKIKRILTIATGCYCILGATSNLLAQNGQRRVFDTRQTTEKELIDILGERFSASPLNSIESQRWDPSLSLYEGSFTLNTSLKWNPKVEVVYTIPLRKNGSPGEQAKNIVMQGFWPGAAAPPKTTIVDGKPVKEKSKLYGSLSYFSYQLGYTCFSLHIINNAEMKDDPRESYFKGGPEWVDIVFRAQAEIERLYKLKHRKLLLYGHSVGAAFVERIAVASPDRISAVAIHSAPEVSLPTAPSNVAWFLAITRGDSMQADYTYLYNELLSKGTPFVFNIFPPDYEKRGYYHSVTVASQVASMSFFRGVVDEMGTSDKINPAMWPYFRDRTKPLRILSRGSFKAREIPEKDREYLPSRAFAESLQALPAPVEILTIANRGQGSAKCYVALPPLGKPKGIIVYSHKTGIQDLAMVIDNMYFLAGKGYLVISPKIGNAGSSSIQNTLDFIRGVDIFKPLPLLCIGYGESGNILWDVVSREQRIAPKGFALLEFEPHDSLDESKLSPGCGVKCPVDFIYNAKAAMQASTTDETAESLAKFRTVKEFVRKCKDRKQLASVDIVPESVDTDGKITQASIQMVETFLSNIVDNHKSAISDH